jgi:hypothetical protein
MRASPTRDAQGIGRFNALTEWVPRYRETNARHGGD